MNEDEIVKISRCAHRLWIVMKTTDDPATMVSTVWHDLVEMLRDHDAMEHYEEMIRSLPDHMQKPA